MLFPFAATITNAATPPVATLAGVALGTSIATVRREHPDGEVRQNGAGARLTWKRPAGGIVSVLADNTDKVVKISFMAYRGETDSLDAPCVKNFPIQSSPVNFNKTINENECVAIGNDKYSVNNGSIIEVYFGDGQLQLVRWYKPGMREPSWVASKVAVTVFECLHDPAAPPELRVYDIDGIFAADSVAPKWTFEKPAWNATISVPAGHYIFSAHTKHCTGETEQIVAIPNRTRHVTLTLDERQEANAKPFTIRIDEDMYASVVYGLLPSPATRVEIMSADSILGEQTRRTGKIDNGVYEFDHMKSGRYVLRLTFGDIVVSREVTVPPNQYGLTVRADLSPSDASQIVQEQAAGSGIVPLHYNGPALQTFHKGNASVDGWATEPLIRPSDYSPEAQRISPAALSALAATQRFLDTDVRIPGQFRGLSAWSVQLEAQGTEVIHVDLFPTDSTAWLRQAPKTNDLCIPGIGGKVILRFDTQTYKVINAYICP